MGGDFGLVLPTQTLASISIHASVWEATANSRAFDCFDHGLFIYLGVLSPYDTGFYEIGSLFYVQLAIS